MSKYKLLTQEEKMLIEEMWNEGAKLRYIAYTLGRDVTTIARYTKRKSIHRKWSEEDKQTAIRLLREGKNYREIGEALGRTQDAVKQFFVHQRRTSARMLLAGMIYNMHTRKWENG